MIKRSHALILIEGDLPDLSGARVVSIDTPANIAVGDGPWGIDPDVVVPAGGEVPRVARWWCRSATPTGDRRCSR